MPLAQVTVSTTVPLPPHLAWRAYTDAHAITQWNFANDDWHCPSANVDLRVGGAYLTRMEAKDGSFGFDFGGTYHEVDAPKALTLVLGDGRKSRTTFEATTEGSIVTTVFDAETENDVEMQQAGWQAILDNYRKYAESIT
jgi:uncharacterized protein YndB with AHSA1/START domain